ncbi:EAL domain-containing protein [Cohnella sp. REN36]|uniref:EAL domain-containing protein n=1 Tax=Cohnella sp. REN36 TaxID=2887347 RepID=UPI001D139811|nr:EAL domain-containing protein [Cohnella sp. REN36]MCC3375866.1 EAL domain-containing protein [Cohnella sp. REN36]
MNDRWEERPMAAAWQGMDFARFGARMAESPEGSARREGGCGFIAIDLADREASAGPASETPAEWNAWLAWACPSERLEYADRLGTHLWLCAEIPPDGHVPAHEYLTGIARGLRRLLTEHCGSTPGRSGGAWLQDRGFGVAALSDRDGLSGRDAVYEALFHAAGQLRQSLQEQPRTELREEMEELLRAGSLYSVYQPIIWLGDRRVFGYEALSRCPAGSRFGNPMALFGYAEREGYAFALDRLARETAIRSSPPLNPLQKIFINVTMGIMNDDRFVSGQTVQWLRQRGLHPGQVVFELTERSSIDDFAAAKKILGHYRGQGYEIAIDDAGAGYSSLQSIVELRPDYIKIDKSLVQDADRDEMKKQMLRTFVRFAKRMNIKTVAEGIERPEELRLVRSLGTDLGQGYLLGRPQEHGMASG